MNMGNTEYVNTCVQQYEPMKSGTCSSYKLAKERKLQTATITITGVSLLCPFLLAHKSLPLSLETGDDSMTGTQGLQNYKGLKTVGGNVWAWTIF